ncbi:unnamed protein product [Triticum turgidum subsp. durum]|uniref:Wall-associated receptor kinase galacturonan-binding domain-containing protein n=1 Tax=Triticum turgidum subsp. durum TaxID=4567 RepID=A0A9R1Q6H7_TRITD|nr:unnamed protein product [Triticum turgidum subsp. durum]
MAPSCCWLLAFAWVWWLPLLLVAAEEARGEGCSAKCGNVTISHPFWLTDIEAGRSCAPPDFEVTCFNNSSPVLRSSIPFSFRFAIINISYEEDRLHVVDEGKMQILPTSNSCQVPPSNWATPFGSTRAA